MVVKGIVRGGVVVLEPGTSLQEGSQVRIEVVRPTAADSAVPTLYDRVQDFIGIADDLPADMADNHDHYLHGRPKKQ